MIFFRFRFPVDRCCLADQGSPYDTQHIVSVESFIVLKRVLFVHRDDSLTSFHANDRV